jgi:hypothetical protein
LAGFELAVEEEGWIGEFFRRDAEGGKEALKKISAGLRPVRAIQAHAFLEVALRT